MKAADTSNSISLAKLTEQGELMDYIEREWKAGHILARNSDFFKYEYGAGEFLNFVISRDSQGQINGMLGFLKASSQANPDIWTTMWKVSKNTGNPVLGIRLLEYLRSLGFRSVTGSGANAKTIGIYKYLGMATGSLKHFVLLNDQIDDFKIALVPHELKRKPLLFLEKEDISLTELDEAALEKLFASLDNSNRIPHKDWSFFRHRYYRHPIYHYQVFGIFSYSTLQSILVARTVQMNGAAVLRIVDVYGNESNLAYISHFLRTIIVDLGYEYIDFVTFGLDDELLRSAGFMEVSLDSQEFVIPNYFQPFVRQNIRINFFTDLQSLEHFRIYKADGDQDRPN